MRRLFSMRSGAERDSSTLEGTLAKSNLCERACLRAKEAIMFCACLSRRDSALGFTLVELLVGDLDHRGVDVVALARCTGARESGRRATCMNNLKQLGLAAQQHLEKTRRFPTGGWGPRWIGVGRRRHRIEAARRLGLQSSPIHGWRESLRGDRILDRCSDTMRSANK